jgi:hypothetical protein
VTAKRHTRRQRHSYSPEVADLICERLMDDVSLRQICQDTNMPARSTLFLWLRQRPDFRQRYTFSKWLQIQWMADDMVDIADDCDPKNLRLAKRQIAALQSRLSKLKPKRYCR